MAYRRRDCIGEDVPSALGEVNETLALGKSEHGFGFGSVERGLVSLAYGLLEQLWFLHSSKRIIIKKF